jgi:hypothetical protein
MQQGETAEIIAIASSGPRWFYVRTDVGREGWVSPDVVTVQGNVSNLPLRIPPPPPQGEATADPSAPAPDTATEEATAEAAP